MGASQHGRIRCGFGSVERLFAPYEPLRQSLLAARLGWYKGTIFSNARLQLLANQTEDVTVANVASLLPVTSLADGHFTGKQGLQYTVGISVMLLPYREASPRVKRGAIV